MSEKKQTIKYSSSHVLEPFRPFGSLCGCPKCRPDLHGNQIKSGTFALPTIPPSIWKLEDPLAKAIYYLEDCDD